MKKNLLVVETALKARTLWSTLNAVQPDAWIVLEYPVPPTIFPRKLSGGINSDSGFEPLLTPADDEKLSRLQAVCREVEAVYLCFDPSLDGEETAVYLLNMLSSSIDFSAIHRIRFGFITKKSIKKSIEKVSSFDHFSAEKSENLRLLDRMVEYNIRTALGGKTIYDSDVGLCGYYVMSLVWQRYVERRQHVQMVPEFGVAFRSANGALIRSVKSYFQDHATKTAELCMKWLTADHRIGDVTGVDVEISPPELFNFETLVQDCMLQCDMRVTNIVDIVIAMYHEGLITNPYSAQKATPAYGQNVVEYLNSFKLETREEQPQLQGIMPIDIRLDMNRINKSYRPVYRRLWQRTLQAYGTPTRLRKTFVRFNVNDKNTPAGGSDAFFGTYSDVLVPGHVEFFNEIRRDLIPDVLADVVLEKRASKVPSHFMEHELVANLTSLFSVIEIKKALDHLKEANFLRTGTSTLLIPTFRGLLLSFAVFKHVPQLGQIAWINNMMQKVSQPRIAARTALADAWAELKPEIQGLDKHKFICAECCSKCNTELEVVFDKEREPYLLCRKDTTSGCGAVYPILVTETGNVEVFVPYLVSWPCPKCGLLTMRCHNGPYGLFVRCDKCSKTQPFE